MTMKRIVPLLLIFAPAIASAQTNEVSFELIMYAAVGVLGAVSFVVFVAGFIQYLSRLGTERREDSIKIMEWGVSIMVMAVLCAAVLYWMHK